MVTHFEQEVRELKEKLLLMASHATDGLRTAMKALTEREDAFAQAVKAKDDILDRFEIELDETAVLLLAKAPLATQLRTITAAMKISHDLERVGDEATTIARRALELNREAKPKNDTDLRRMAEMALGMLNEALDSFVYYRPARALEVIRRDKEVDEVNKRVHRELAEAMVDSPALIPQFLNLMVISKSLERIADHATNIAEEVIYLHEAKDVRHTNVKGKAQREGD